jgi:L-ascorbate metabolism protein UlaG (beta-lactamase superfamily)
MCIALIIILVIVLAVLAFFQQPQFGRRPTGKRLERIKQSPNYHDGAFQNISDTPSLTEGATFPSVIKEYFFGKHERLKPLGQMPAVKTNLHQLDINENVLVWFGHSSYYMQVDGKRILVDPVFSGHASPFSFTTNSFAGTDIYSVDDIPAIDYLFITHDHWDHLDYSTVKQLKPKVKQVITGLGTGSHLERWGYESIIELDWNEAADLGDGFKTTAVSGRHFSGRGFIRNKTLWASFVFTSPNKQIFIGGDSGYDKHFAEIGRAFGPFDLAILENGQYNKSWKHIHMMPNEVLQAAKDLGAKKILPVHSSKFSLSLHTWDEPLSKVAALGKETGIPVLTPMIGEVLRLDGSNQQFTNWWEGVK